MNQIDFMVNESTDRLFVDVRDVLSMLYNINELEKIQTDPTTIKLIQEILLSFLLSIENDVESNVLTLDDRQIEKLYDVVEKDQQIRTAASPKRNKKPVAKEITVNINLYEHISSETKKIVSEVKEETKEIDHEPSEIEELKEVEPIAQSKKKKTK